MIRDMIHEGMTLVALALFVALIVSWGAIVFSVINVGECCEYQTIYTPGR